MTQNFRYGFVICLLRMDNKWLKNFAHEYSLENIINSRKPVVQYSSVLMPVYNREYFSKQIDN